MRWVGAIVIFAAATATAQSVTTYGYDALGRVTAKRDGAGNRSDYAYDPASNRSAYQSAQQFTTSYDAVNAVAHQTGQADADGWAVNYTQTGYMIFGPYDTTVPVGNHVATWRILVDNNTANNVTLITLDVRDNATGTILASLSVTRQQWTAAGAYQVFEVPFNNATAGHQLEFRVYANGGSYVRVQKLGYY